VAKIKIKGVIVSNDDKWVYDWFGIESVSPGDVVAQIDQSLGEDIEVEINSGGGDVYSGSEIYTALKAYKGNVITQIVGIAASAASVVAMAGKKVSISPTAQIMIHNVSSMGSGDYRDFEHEAKVLKNFNVSIANAYILKTGMKQKDLLDMMNKETWLNAQQALELHFADEIMFNESRLVAGIYQGMIPQEVIAKMKSQKINEKNDEAKLASAKLKLLFLKGAN